MNAYCAEVRKLEDHFEGQEFHHVSRDNNVATDVGDLVLRRIQSTKGMHKLSAPWEGPFIMMEVVSPSTYHLQWANSQGVPNVWNIEHLRRFYP
jgi:hypothetical protein